MEGSEKNGKSHKLVKTNSGKTQSKKIEPEIEGGIETRLRKNSKTIKTGKDEMSESEVDKKHKKIKNKENGANGVEIENQEKEAGDKKLKLSSYRVSKNTRKILRERGIKAFFPIQAATFDHVYDGKDLIGRDRTGSGKTLSYALPIVEKFREDEIFNVKKKQTPLVIVILPTRELAIQVNKEFEKLKSSSEDFRVNAFYGGTEYGPQCNILRNGCEIVVGTPGRLIDLIERDAMSLQTIKVVILDEADQMLDMGFDEDMEKIFKLVKERSKEKNVQKLLFSATIPSWVLNVAKKYLSEDYVMIDLVKNSNIQTSLTVQHYAVHCPFFQRIGAVGDLVRVYGGQHGRTIIFTETKKEANEISSNAKINQETHVLHGDIPQKQREVTFQQFRDGKVKCLIATNVAARGLDIPEVDLIIQLDPPKDVDTYIHRVGRTARAGKEGCCITFYTPKTLGLLERIENKAKINIKRIGTPQPSDLIKASARDIFKSLEMIDSDVLYLFEDVANDMLKHYGATEALTRAFAFISGTKEKVKQRSLLNSMEGFISYYFQTDVEIRFLGFVWSILKKNLPENVCSGIKGMKLTKDKRGAVFDVPEEFKSLMDGFIEDITENGKRNYKLEVATTIPDIEESYNNQSGGPRQVVWTPGRGNSGRGGSRNYRSYDHRSRR